MRNNNVIIINSKRVVVEALNSVMFRNLTIRPLQALLMISAISSGLSGCASSGNGSGSQSPPPPPPAAGFTSFSALPKSATTKIPGITLEGTYTAPAPNYLVTALSAPTSGVGNVAVTLDANGNRTAETVTGALSSVSFSTTDGSTSVALTNLGAPGATLTTSANGQNALVNAEPTVLGYNYQTYGIWATGLGTGSGNYGAISVGAATAPASVPTTGSATYAGNAGGLYIDASGVAYLAASAATLNADFVNRNIAFSSTGTEIVPENNISSSPASAPYLDFTGSLTYASGSSNFTGSITNGTVTGVASGQFYGPNANEIGGTFSLLGSGVQSYIGAFGGKR